MPGLKILFLPLSAFDISELYVLQKMEHVVVEDVLPLPYWIPWEHMFPPISELR